MRILRVNAPIVAAYGHRTRVDEAAAVDLGARGTASARLPEAASCVTLHVGRVHRPRRPIVVWVDT